MTWKQRLTYSVAIAVAETVDETTGRDIDRLSLSWRQHCQRIVCAVQRHENSAYIGVVRSAPRRRSKGAGMGPWQCICHLTATVLLTIQTPCRQLLETSVNLQAFCWGLLTSLDSEQAVSESCWT